MAPMKNDTIKASRCHAKTIKKVAETTVDVVLPMNCKVGLMEDISLGVVVAVVVSKSVQDDSYNVVDGGSVAVCRVNDIVLDCILVVVDVVMREEEKASASNDWFVVTRNEVMDKSDDASASNKDVIRLLWIMRIVCSTRRCDLCRAYKKAKRSSFSFTASVVLWMLRCRCHFDVIGRCPSLIPH